MFCGIGLSRAGRSGQGFSDGVRVVSSWKIRAVVFRLCLSLLEQMVFWLSWAIKSRPGCSDGVRVVSRARPWLGCSDGVKGCSGQGNSDMGVLLYHCYSGQGE